MFLDAVTKYLTVALSKLLDMAKFKVILKKAGTNDWNEFTLKIFIPLLNGKQLIQHTRGVIKKKPLFSNFVSYVCSFFALYCVMLVHMSDIYVDNISHFGLSVCFW